jgi:outer membrane protein assembly factor BamA
VDIQPEPIPVAAEANVVTPAPPVEQPIRAKVTLTEWPGFHFRYGLEVNDQLNTPSKDASRFAPEPSSHTGRVFGLGIASDISTRNLFGNAISVGLAGRYTRDFRAGRAYATMPFFFGRRIASTLFLSRSREQLPETAVEVEKKPVVDKTDLTLEQRVKPFPRTEVAYSYTFERNHTFDLVVDPFEAFPFDIAVNVARLASTVLVDTRDDLVDATHGWFHSSDFEYAPPALGSETRFVKYVLQQRYYRRVGGVVLASAARLGLATGFDQDLLPSERFFAGGGYSVRGYDEDVLGPRDRFDTVVGGNALLVLNEEIRFPIFKIVRGVGFFDAGRAFDLVGNLTLKGLPSGMGVGLRVQTPVVLLRFDVAKPLDSTLGAGGRRWFFSIGQLF